VLISRAGSNGNATASGIRLFSKGGVYDARETVWAFGGAEERRVVPLEGGPQGRYWISDGKYLLKILFHRRCEILLVVAKA
jgi:hypothetical protein